SLIGATVFVAIATTVLAVGAIVTAVFAILAFRNQAEEVGILQQQMHEHQQTCSPAGQGFYDRLARRGVGKNAVTRGHFGSRPRPSRLGSVAATVGAEQAGDL